MIMILKLNHSSRVLTLFTVFALVSSAAVANADPKGPTGLATPIFLPGEAEGDAEQAFNALLDNLDEHPNSPVMVLALSKLSRFFPLLPDGRQRVFKRMQALAKNPKLTNHWNKELIDAELVGFMRACGQGEAAKALQLKRGYVRRWLGIGAFGRTSLAGLEQVFELEKHALREQLDLKQSYKSRRKTVSWHDLSEDLSPWSLQANVFNLASTGRGNFYAMAHVHSDSEQQGLIVYSGGHAKFWLNRRLLGRVNRAEQRLGQTLQFPITLQKGWNRILVKLAGGFSFSMRLTSAEGQPLAFEEQAGLLCPKVKRAAAETTQAPQKFATHAAFEKLSSWALDLKVAYGLYLIAEQGLNEEGVLLIEEVLKEPASANSAWLHFLAAQAVDNAEHLIRSARKPRAQALMRKARELSQGPFRPALRMMSDALRVQGQADDAVGILEDALFPESEDGKVSEAGLGDLETALDLQSLYTRLGWLGEAEALLSKLLKHHGDLDVLLRVKASEYQRQGQIDKALEIHKTLHKRNPRSTFYLSQSQRLAVQQGRFKEAWTLLKQRLGINPVSPLTRLGLELELYVAEGRVDKELETLRKISDLQPENVSALERYGQRLAQLPGAEHQKEALDVLDSVLLREPNRHHVRRLLHSLRGTKDEFWKAWLPSLDDLRKIKVDVGNFPQASTIALIDLEITRLQADGSSENIIYQAYRIRDERGVQEMGQRSNSGQVMEICTLLPDGSKLEPITTSGGGYQMPGLQPGAIVVHCYRSTRGRAGFQFSYGPWYFRDPSQRSPYMLSRWVLIHPKQPNFEIVESNMPNAAKVSEGKDGTVTRVWETRNLDRVEPENLMPERDEFLPHVKLLERRKLNDLIPFYIENSIGGSQVTPSIQAAADAVVKDLKGDYEKAKALFRFVKDTVKGRGFAPTASQILSSKQGNRLILLRALLKAVGLRFDNAIAGLNPDVDSETNWSEPELGQFQTSLLRVYCKDHEPIWVYPEGPRYISMQRLPEILFGAPVMLLGPESHGLKTLPKFGYETLAQDNVTHIKLAKDGSANVVLTSINPGFNSYSLKERVQTISQNQLKNILQSQAHQLFPGARLKTFEFTKTRDPKVPFTNVMNFDVPRMLRPRGKGLAMPLGIAPLFLTQNFGLRPKRRFDVVIRSWIAMRDTVTVALGPLEMPNLPESIYLKTDFGSYSLTFQRRGQRKGGQVVVKRHLLIKPRRVKVDDYQDLLNFIEAVDTAEQTPLIIEKR